MYSVLVVDDDDLVGRMIVRLLGRDGHDVVLLDDAREAQRIARSFDVGIFDWNLPGPSGLELARELCARGRVARVVFFTGGAVEDADVTAASELGPVLSKDAFELRDLLRSWQAARTG
jgi:DNA-binding response OmpR family regulator